MPAEPKKILIIEDEKPMARALELKLTHAGFDVLEAKNGEEGLDVALREHPDLILLDIIMPVMDGVTMLNKLRHDSWGTKVAVIMLTNLSGAEDSLMRSSGSLDYIVKSDWKIEDVVAKIRGQLGE
jgi:two-component system, OmpR family, response regulator ArlR